MTGAVTAVQVGSSPRCRSCNAAIWFGRTAKGKRMPIDPTPVENGNVVVDQDMKALDMIGSAFPGDPDPERGVPVRVLHKDEAVDPDVPRYVSHFATCTDPKRHRREDRRHNGSKAKARAMGMETRP